MKKALTIGIIIGVVLVVGALLFLLIQLGVLQSFLIPGGFKNMQYALTQETPQYYDYHLTWEASVPQTGCASAEVETPFSFTTSHNILSASETLYGIYGDPSAHTFYAGDSPYVPFTGNPYGITPVPSGSRFTATNIQLNGVRAISNPCSSDRKEVGFTYTQLQVECQVQSPQSLFREDASGYIFCTWSGIAKSNDGSPILLEGLNSGSADVKMYKQGYTAPEVSVSFYRLANNQCSSVTILPSQKTANDYTTMSECKSHTTITAPSVPSSNGFLSFLTPVFNWISTLFHSFFFSQSITGNANVQPNTQQTYQLSIQVPPSDTNYLDGTASWQYGYWGLLDSSGNVKQSGTPELVSNGDYEKTVTLTTPNNVGDYVLVGFVTEIDGTFSQTSNSWNYTTENIINKQAINISSRYSVTAPTTPTSSGFQNFINSIFNFFKNLFGIK